MASGGAPIYTKGPVYGPTKGPPIKPPTSPRAGRVPPPRPTRSGGARPFRGGSKSKGGQRGQRSQRGGQRGRAPQAPNPLLDPTQVLSGKPLDQAAQGIADAQTVGPLSELAKQIAANNQQTAGVQKQDFGYFMGLAKAAQDSVNQSQMVSGQLNTNLANIGQGTQQQLGQLGAQAQGGVNARLQALGLGGDTQQGLQAEMARQQGIGALQSQAAQNFGAQQGASNVQAAVADRGATGLAGQQDIANVALRGQQANEPLNAKIAGLQASRGALKATALGQLRSAERNYMIAQEGLSNTAANNAAQNQLTAQQNAALDYLKAQGLNVSVANTKTRAATSRANNAANNATSLANTGSRNATSRANNAANNATARRGQDLRAMGGTAQKPLPPVSNNRVLSQISRIQQLIRDGQAKKVPGAQIRANLQDGQNPSKTSYDKVLVDAAWEILGYGHLLPKTAAALHSRGIRGGGYKIGPVPKPGGVLGGILNNVP